MKNRTILPSSFASRLQVRRIECGLTQAELAAKIGVSSRIINTWENPDAASDPKSSNILALCKALNCSFEHLFGGDIDAPPSKMHEYIHDKTGLSYRAVDRLSFLQHIDPDIIEFVNNLLSSPHFFTAIQNLMLSARLKTEYTSRDSISFKTDSFDSPEISSLEELRKDYFALSNDMIEQSIFGKVVELPPDDLAKYYYMAAKESLEKSVSDLYKNMIKQSQKLEACTNIELQNSKEEQWQP